MNTIKLTKTRRLRIIAFLLQVDELSRGMVVGYRFLDENSLEIHDYTEEQTSEIFSKRIGRRVILSNGSLLHKRGHLSLTFGKQLVPTTLLSFNLADGDVKNLPVVDVQTGECLFNNSFIFRAKVINRLQEVGFLVTSYTGECLFLTANELLKFSQSSFYNGKRIIRGEDITFVELKGNMPEIQLSMLKQQNSQRVHVDWGKYSVDERKFNKTPPVLINNWWGFVILSKFIYFQYVSVSSSSH